MNSRPGAVIEPGARKAEIRAVPVREADGFRIEGDRALEVPGPNVHVMDLNRHGGLRICERTKSSAHLRFASRTPLRRRESSAGPGELIGVKPARGKNG